MATDTTAEELEELARDAKVMTEAAKILNGLADGTRGLDDTDGLDEDLSGESPDSDDEGSEASPRDVDVDEAADNFEGAAETVEQVSLSMTMVLAHHGVVPDFDEDLYDEDDGDDDTSPAFQ